MSFVFPDRIATLPRVAVVLTNPTGAEVGQRCSFVGPEATFAEKCLRLAGISLNVCSFFYLFPEVDKPISHYITLGKTHSIVPTWTVEGCQAVMSLSSRLAELKPAVIYTIDDLPTFALTNRWNIYNYRGSLLPSNMGALTIPLLSKAFIEKGNTKYLHVNLFDMKKGIPYFDKPFTPTPRECLISPNFDNACKFLDISYQRGLQGNPISFDIETKFHELNCISFSFSPTSAMSIPFVYDKGPYFTLPEECEIMRKIGRILCSPNIKKRGQNLAFDSHFMLRRYGMRVKNLDDTMIAQHSIHHDLPKGLDMITSMWTDLPYYKGEGKEWFAKGGAYEKLWNYNCLDSIVCSEAFPKQVQVLNNIANMDTYERQLRILEPCVYMMEHGIRVDMEGMRAARTKLEHEVEVLRNDLTRIAPGLNPQSSPQLIKYFYQTKGYPTQYNQERKVCCDALAMKKLAAMGSDEAQLIRDIKKREKLIATYLADMKFDSDGRIRCSYNPVGTAFSRLSSAASLFGTGMNMQNWPRNLLRHLKPDEGYVYYGVDLSQAENRIVAYVGNIEQMIHAFETNQDVHRLTASMLFHKPPEEISDEPGSCDLGDGEHSERDWGKKTNHSLNYDFGVQSFALKYELPLAEAKILVNAYHAGFPGVRKGFHALVKNSLNKTRSLVNLMGRKTIFLSELGNTTYRAAYACIPQGTVGDVINERGMAYTYYNNGLFAPLELLVQVHDSIGFQLPLSLPWEVHARILQSLKDSLEIPLRTHTGREFVVPADFCMSLSLCKEEGVEFKAKKWPSNLELLTQTLQTAYTKLKEREHESSLC